MKTRMRMKIPTKTNNEWVFEHERFAHSGRQHRCNQKKRYASLKISRAMTIR
jgi:hypothetical protein